MSRIYVPLQLPGSDSSRELHSSFEDVQATQAEACLAISSDVVATHWLCRVPHDVTVAGSSSGSSLIRAPTNVFSTLIGHPPWMLSCSSERHSYNLLRCTEVLLRILSWNSSACAPCLRPSPQPSTPTSRCRLASTNTRQGVRTFRPRGFAPPRRFTPVSGSSVLQPDAEQGSPRFSAEAL